MDTDHKHPQESDTAPVMPGTDPIVEAALQARPGCGESLFVWTAIYLAWLLALAGGAYGLAAVAERACPNDFMAAAFAVVFANPALVSIAGVLLIARYERRHLSFVVVPPLVALNLTVAVSVAVFGVLLQEDRFDPRGMWMAMGLALPGTGVGLLTLRALQRRPRSRRLLC